MRGTSECMINLDYTTINPRWERRGLEFNDIFEYAKILGFLSNIEHYKGKSNNNRTLCNSISLQIEGNYLNGAWAKECRIHYYKELIDLKNNLPALYRAKSAGRGNITCRINSNKFIKHLIDDYNFTVITGKYTKPIYPASYNIIISRLRQYLEGNISLQHINLIMNEFDIGFNL